ncbi:MAG: S-layer homology domain-containing protein, partial [Rubrobacteridae bacterium]|nr:S-layer homology domain-containing protein [Rubrobacteridae bacterium]
IQGTATDDNGLTRVEVAISRSSDGKYFNGTSWQNAIVWNNATGKTSWSYSWNFISMSHNSGVTYTIKARAYDTASQYDPTPAVINNIRTINMASGESGPFIPSVKQAPAKPQNLHLIVNVGAIELAWDANKESDLAGYNVYRGIKGSNDSLIKLNGSLITKAEFKDSTAAIGTNYMYYVSALNNTSQESERSTPVEASLAKVDAAVIFSDILPGSWYADSVSALISRGIIDGYDDGTFKPSKNITREEIAKMICLAMNWELVRPVESSFLDVDKDRWSFAYIETAKAHGAISGYPNGTFKPASNLTRAELALIIVKAKGLAFDVSGTDFSDVGADHWAYKYIMTARNKGILKGTGNLYYPNDSCTRAEVATAVNRLMNI